MILNKTTLYLNLRKKKRNVCSRIKNKATLCNIIHLTHGVDSPDGVIRFIIDFEIHTVKGIVYKLRYLSFFYGKRRLSHSISFKRKGHPVLRLNIKINLERENMSPPIDRFMDV